MTLEKLGLPGEAHLYALGPRTCLQLVWTLVTLLESTGCEREAGSVWAVILVTCVALADWTEG